PLPAARGEVGLPTGPARIGRPDEKLRNPVRGRTHESKPGGDAPSIPTLLPARGEKERVNHDLLAHFHGPGKATRTRRQSPQLRPRRNSDCPMNAPVSTHPTPPCKHTPLFPLGKDDTPYRKIAADGADWGVRVERIMGEDVVVVPREALRALSEAA